MPPALFSDGGRILARMGAGLPHGMRKRCEGIHSLRHGSGHGPEPGSGFWR